MPPVKRYGSSRSSCRNAFPLLSMAISSSRSAREAQVPTATPAGSLRNSRSNGWTPTDTSSLGNTQPRTRCIPPAQRRSGLRSRSGTAPPSRPPWDQACRLELQELFSLCYWLISFQPRGGGALGGSPKVRQLGLTTGGWVAIGVLKLWQKRSFTRYQPIRLIEPPT